MTQKKIYWKILKKIKYRDWIILFIASCLYTFSIQGFLSITMTFAAGVGAIGQLLTFIFKDLKEYFSLLYLALNLPLIILFWKKIKKQFLLKTIFFLICQASLGTIFLIDDVFNSIQNILNIKNISTAKEVREEIWPILILSILASIIGGGAVGLAWKFGGSTGGIDIIAYYYSTKRKESIGKFLFIISILIVAFSLMFTLVLNKESRKYILITSFSTIIFILNVTFITNKIYPKYSKIELEIHSTKINEIIKMLKKVGFIHSYSINQFISGYNNKERKHIKTVILLLEKRELLNKIYKIDSNVWISIKYIKKIIGNFNTTSVE